MKTLIFIHGAESFTEEQEYQSFLKEVFVPRYSKPWEDFTKADWRLPIARNWVGNGGVVYYPTMPNKQNARYADWKIVFEGILEKLSSEDTLTLVGGSLGGCFLLKYFSEVSDFPYPISQIHLLAACIEAGDFTPPDNYEFLQEIGEGVHIWHAEDDSVVSFAVGQELARILPEAQLHFFSSEKGYGHFYGIERIPELEGEILK